MEPEYPSRVYTHMKSAFLLLSLLLIFSGSAAEARPISYPGGWMVMQENDFESNSLQAHYTFTPRYSVGLESILFRDEGDVQMHMLQQNVLLKRWNGIDSQANFYFTGSAGVAEADGRERPALRGGIEADWEDRKFLVAYENRYTYANGLKEDYTQMFRAGIAPYVAEYGELHTWLILQVDHQPEAEDEIVVTPLVRLFKGYGLVEAGISSNRNILFNIVYQF